MKLFHCTVVWIWCPILSFPPAVILFTGEATFTRNRINNTRNSHRWSHDNPHDTVETEFQRRFSISVWCGMIDDVLVGPVVSDDSMTGHNYLDFLQSGLPEQLEDVPLAARIAMYFQHDGAPSHYTRLNPCFCKVYIYIYKLRGRSPQANYTDRATAACRRS
jgi:hypothetical protein